MWDFVAIYGKDVSKKPLLITAAKGIFRISS